MVKKLLYAFGLLLFVGAAAAVTWIGPRNVLGILRYDQRREGALRVGDPAPDVELVSPSGQTVPLRERVGGRPLVLVFGSFT